MKKCIAILLSFYTGFSLKAQSFPASEIPDSLKTNANVVIRLEEMVFEIKSIGHAVTKEKHVYTILNKIGEKYATYRTFYGKFTTINYVNASMYDANGKELKHFKKKDMSDLPIQDGYSLVNDSRIKEGSFYYHEYPYTVEFEEEDEINGFMTIANWFPQTSIEASVEDSKYSIIAPEDYSIRYKMLNSDILPAIGEKSGKKTYMWELRGLSAFGEIPFSAPLIRYAPCLMVGASDIEEEGYRGNMSTWNDFGKFYGSLQKGRDVLPEEVKQKVHRLTDAIPEPEKKVAILYEFLQKNTHYVSIQLGIGGWQTFDAAYVAHNKYGDCKALSNFMVALLKEASIKAHSVIIHGGEQNADFIKDFTYDPFNHVICCVPLPKDTIWLECTSPYLPAGYLSDFTSNRYGLQVDDDGGELIHTPAYLLPDNSRMRKISAVLDKEGNLKLESRTSYKAACQDNINQFINYESKDEQLRTLKNKFDLPTYDVNAFDYKEDYSKRLPVIQEALQLSVTNYAQVSGRRIFINPDIFARLAEKLPEDKDRKWDLEFKDEYLYVDSIEISIPTGYETESRPKDILLQSKFGKYETHLQIASDKITYYRKFVQYSGRFPGKDYEEVVNYYDQIYDADHTKIVFVKKI